MRPILQTHRETAQAATARVSVKTLTKTKTAQIDENNKTATGPKPINAALSSNATIRGVLNNKIKTVLISAVLSSAMIAPAKTAIFKTVRTSAAPSGSGIISGERSAMIATAKTAIFETVRTSAAPSGSGITSDVLKETAIATIRDGSSSVVTDNAGLNGDRLTRIVTVLETRVAIITSDTTASSSAGSSGRGITIINGSTATAKIAGNDVKDSSEGRIA